MFDIRIEKIYYVEARPSALLDLPIVKANITIRDDDTFTRRTWMFNVDSYAKECEKTGVIEPIIKDLVHNMWTDLHNLIPKVRTVCIDLWLPISPSNAERDYMDELFDKYLKLERNKDAFCRLMRLMSNSTFGLGVIDHDMRHMYPGPIIPESSPLYGKDMKQTFIDETLLDTDLADSIMDTIRYAQHDINKVMEAKEKIKEYKKMQIEDVIYNNPATIVFWRDGSKTVVKAQDGEPYDPEKGLAMAIAKKVYGNKYNYYNTIKHWTKRYKPKEDNKNE